MRSGRGRALHLAIATIVLVGACSSSAASPSGPPPAASGAAGISVTGAWIRDSTAMTGVLAGYLVITNSGPVADTLLQASSPVARTVQLHETVSVPQLPTPSGMGGTGSAMPSASGTRGMMTMVQVDKVEIPAGGTIEFRPGGYHIMFMDLIGTLTAGRTVDLTLTFANAGPITVKAEVRAQ